MHKRFFHKCAFALVFSIVASTIFSCTSFAVPDYHAEAEARKSLPVETNSIPNWPQGPSIGAEGAILMDAETGAILYGKNIHEKLYPASTTKILTTLIAAENCSLDEVVTFSHDAVFSVPYDGSNIGMDEGEELTMEQCLAAILISSANEVSNAVGEHVSGSMEAFALKMTERAKELGCLNSNFVNANGLYDDNHYTTAYDLATIGRAFFANELLCKYASTKQVHIPPTEKQPDDIYANSKNQLYEGRTYSYEYLVGSKTGYTDEARQTLVSCAEKDGMKLICVILKEESPYQYEDTLALFNYGFSNFTKINISEEETKYNINNSSFFYSENDIFGNSQPILSLDSEDYIILPNTARFDETQSSISYDNVEEGEVALITYTYQGQFVGSATLNYDTEAESSYYFNEEVSDEATPAKEAKEEDNVIMVNILTVILWVVGIAVLIIALIILYAFINSYHFAGYRKRRSRKRRKKERRYRSEFDNYKF